MKKIILFIISLGLAFGGGRALSTRYGGQKLGAFSDPFISIQLAASPSNGLCLTTDGTNNSWASCSSGSGAAFAWTPALNFGVNTNSTSTDPIWFRASPYSLFASSTAVLTYASSTAFTVTGNSYLGTVSSGVWNGTTIAIADGGTGLTAIGASSTVLTTNGSVAQWNKLATSQLTNDSGFGTGSVTSIATTYPITGGPITTTGTLALAFGTTTTSNWVHQIFTSLVATNASTTNATTTNTFTVPVKAALVTPLAGNVGIDTTSGQFRYSDVNGTTRVLDPVIDSAFVFATSSLGTGTTTFKVAGFSRGTTYTSMACTSSGSGTFTAVLGDSTATSTYVISTTGLSRSFTTLSSNNTFVAGEDVWYDIGSVVGTVVNPTCSRTRTITSD